MRLPGRWLRIAAARLCTRRTLERVIDPIVADVQTEYEEAIRARRWWRAAWVCVSGYTAFWKAVTLYGVLSGPRVLRPAIAADGGTVGRTIAYSLIAFIGLTLLLTAPPLIDARSRFDLWLAVLLLPQAIPLSIPIALSLGIVCGTYDARVSARRIRGVLFVAAVAALLAFAAMLLVPIANQAFRVALAEKLELRGITEYSLPRGANELPLSELRARSKEYVALGLPERARSYEHTYHVRFALPVATVVLSLSALCIAAIVRGRAWRTAAIVVVVQAYWATLALGEMTDSLTAAVAVWAPNVVFTAISVGVLRTLRARLPNGGLGTPA